MRRKPYAFENAVPCDHTAPSPCENHSAYCDMWYGTECDWLTCRAYLPKEDTKAADKSDNVS